MRKTILFGVMSLAVMSCSSPADTNNTQTQNSEEIQNTEESQPQEEPKTENKPMEYVVIQTNKGDISLELDPNKAPISVNNFLTYVDEGYYDGTIFHRVMPGFMIQGGGFTPDGTQKETKSPIELESNNGLSNVVGSIAMARTNSPNSATSQFFINVAPNESLDYRPGFPGYAVFGKVTSGMDVVNEIRQVETGRHGGHADWPKDPVIIEKVTRE